MTVLAMPLLPVLELSNIVMLFMLAVVAIAVRHGRRAAPASAALLNVLAFDFFFVPRFTTSRSATPNT
jgi:two-component system sensor histidine kinase KdpD